MPEVEDAANIDFLELGDNPATATPIDRDEEDDNKDRPENTEENTPEEKDQELTEEPQQEEPQDNTTDKTDNSGSQDDDTDGDDDSPEDDSEESTDDSLFATMIESSGVDLDDDTRNQLLSLEEDTENFNKVADTIAEKKAERRFESLIEKYPEAAQLVQYRDAGGDPEKFFEAHFPQTDYNEVEFEQVDEQGHKQIIADHLSEQGLEQDEIQAQIQDYEDAGILDKTAERSLKALRRIQERKTEEFEQHQQQLIEQQQQRQQEQYEQINGIIDEGVVEGVKIPQDKKNDFKKYLFEPIDQAGRTQAQIDSENLDLEQRILIAYLNHSGHNLDNFIRQQAGNSTKKNIRESLKRGNDKEDLKGKGRDNSKPGNPDDIVSPFVTN